MYRSVPSRSPVIVRPASGPKRARPKSVDPDLAGGVDHQVAGLDVAVDDADRVGVLQGVGRVGDQVGDCGGRDS